MVPMSSLLPPSAADADASAGRTRPSPDPARLAPSLRRVLLVKLSSLGDIVHALPLADALRAALPDAHIAWAVRRRFADLLLGNPNLDRVYILEGGGIGDVLALGKTLRRVGGPFDAALDAQGLLISGLVARLSGAPLRIGLDRNREGNALWMTHPVVPAKGRVHMVGALLGFCDALGLPRSEPRPQHYLADAEPERAEELLAGGPAAGGRAPRAGLIVGASSADKAWPPARWAELARRLADHGVRPVLLGGPGEAAAAAVIAEEAKAAAPLNLAGKTASLRVLASVLARCAVVIGGDSGPTHLAVAVGTPAVGLYGVTDPARTGPGWGPAQAVVLDHCEGDAPPETRRPRHPAVPDALARIPAEAVLGAVLGLLPASAAAGAGPPPRRRSSTIRRA
jgi:lipopolysaccharide heptosyltransferase I